MPEATPIALSTANLARLASTVAVPSYERASLVSSIVHIGVGGFHRAHLATYVHELCGQGHRDWSICGAGLLPGDRAMAEALDAQDQLYSLIERGTETRVSVIGSITEYLLAEGEPSLLAARIADPRTEVVSLTVTEAGYPIDDVDGEFLADSAMAGPRSAFAVIAAGLQRRRQSGGRPLTVLSFDNIVGNGDATRTAVVGEAARIDDRLATWIADAVTFPNSMVDRITPATRAEHRHLLADGYGVGDRWPVVAEPFRQWVLEDSFAAARPPLEDLDVTLTTDVAPYEAMKLRLLNAGHSCLAYLAALDGAETVDEAMADESLRRFVRVLLDREARPVLPPIPGMEVDAYIDLLLHRFANPHLDDQISRLCLDGSAKMASFLMPTVRAQLEQGGPVGLSALAVAGWCEYLIRWSRDGSGLVPAADASLDAALTHARAAIAEPRAFLRYHEVFGTDVGNSERFEQAFVRAITGLRADGVRSTLTSTLFGVDQR